MRRASYFLLVVFSILSDCAAESGKQQAAFPIKIGLLSDSQITSQNGFSDFSQRSKFAKAMVNVAIRPPAMECYLSEEMLLVALNKLTQDPYGYKKGVDVILFLGDAANSGGADEINTVLAILAGHRERTGVPIFIIIGNHDYLGVGNIVTPPVRFALLNRNGRPNNPALTKYEVLKKFSEFNRGNNLLFANNRFLYVDNNDVLEQNKNLDHHTGLYLSGILTYKEGNESIVDFLLLDSSDYKDAPVWSETAELGFFGVIGSVSFKDESAFVSQVSFLKQYARTSRPQFRFMASHYPKDHLDRVTFAKPGQVPLEVTNFTWATVETAFAASTFSKSFNQSIEPLVIPTGKNYWLSGHTHVTTLLPPDRFIVGGLLGEKYFTGLNIGSTTDYRAHVAVVERYEHNKNNRMDDFVGYREIPLFDGAPTLLTLIPKAIGEYGRQLADDPNFQQIIPSLDDWRKEQQVGVVLNVGAPLLEGLFKGNKMTEEDSYWIDVGATILGLNRKYTQNAWQDQQTNVSAGHLRTFVTQFVSRTGSNREEVLSCLDLLAGAYENKLLPGKCDLNSECLKELCRIPK